MPFPFILIQFQTWTFEDSSIYLHCLVSLRGLTEFLPDSSQKSVDSRESLKEIVSALLGTDAMYKHLKPYLDEFGISKSAITPYEIVFWFTSDSKYRLPIAIWDFANAIAIWNFRKRNCHLRFVQTQLPIEICANANEAFARHLPLPESITTRIGFWNTHKRNEVYIEKS